MNNNLSIAVNSREIDAQNNNYGIILQDYNLYSEDVGYYFLVGSKPSFDDKKIYISVIISQIRSLLHVLIPFLRLKRLPFCFIKDKDIAEQLLCGNLGIHQIGKIVIIYLHKDLDFISFTRELNNLLHEFKGPEIPDHLPLGKIIYTNPDQNEIKPTSSEKIRIYQNNYLILSSLKHDAKGDVFKCFYIKGLVHLGICVVKQGKNCMWSDDVGRDIKDRLEWQLKIHNDLSGVINIPKIIDLFEDNNNTYLVMDFIKGKPLSQVIDEIYMGRSWLYLRPCEKNKLVNLSIEILEIIEKIHNKGYVHRDLTSENFLITPKNRLYVIDWELAYKIGLEYPFPPFRLGSMGYMSPEQQIMQKPTYREDIYALGALMMVFFTNLHPAKFDVQNAYQIENSIFFFTGNLQLARVIAKCVNASPFERPDLSQIKDALVSLPISKDALRMHNTLFQFPHANQKSIINNLGISAFEGLTISTLINNGLLYNSIDDFASWISNPRTFVNVGEGLMSPVTGMIYSIYMAKSIGLRNTVIDSLKEYFKDHTESFLIKREEPLSGLFYGLAGKAIALHYGVLAGVFLDNQKIFREIISCFNKQSCGLDIANGVAGQAFSAMLIYEATLDNFFRETLEEYIKIITSLQNSDGSWPVTASSNKEKQIITGLETGVSGIIILLVKFDQLFPNDQTKVIIERALLWLSDNIPKKRKIDQSLSTGLAGVALGFLIAYKHLKNIKFKDMAENILRQLTVNIVSADYSLATGLSGMGIVYAEAAKICNSKEWEEKATWIYQVLSHMVHIKDVDKISWNTNGFNEKSRGWVNGPLGIIFFIFRLQESNVKN